MPYLTSLLLVAAATLVLLGLLARLAGAARRARRSVRDARAGISEHTGLLAARLAALRLELARCHHSRSGNPGDPVAA